VRLAPGSDPSNNCYIEFGTDNQPGTGNPIFLRSTTLVNKNSWNLITVSRNGSTGAERLYVNGTLSGSRTLTTNYLFNSSITFYPTLGANQWSSTNTDSYFQGMLDSVNVWNKELTQSEVTELYNSGAGKQLTPTPIVTNGLVLNLDAGRKSSYPNVGTTWIDISGNGNNGTMVNGPIFGTTSGGQITFDGINDFVSVPDINISTQISIETWVYANSVGAYNSIASQWRADSFPSSSWVLETVGSDVRLYITNGADISFASTNFQTGIWTHVIGTYDNSIIKIYKNSVLGSTTGILATINNSNLNINIGAIYSLAGVQGGVANWNGKISNTKIYNRALSQSEITQNFNATKSRFGL
jgi:hypothetical protein